MRAILKLAATLAVLVLGGCASAYGPDTWTGGYSERQLGNGDWSVTYLGNGFTTQETAQTYWLYRCSQLTLDKGYDGFELSNPASAGENLTPFLHLARAIRRAGLQTLDDRIHPHAQGADTFEARHHLRCARLESPVGPARERPQM